MTAPLRRFASRLRNAFGASGAEDALGREVAAHLAMLEDEYRHRGMTPDAARFAARRAMGGIEQAKERHREARSFAWIDDLRRDVRDALRAIGRNRGFAALVVLTLGAGIGATTAVYSALDAALLRPLPFPGAGQLVRVQDAIVPLDLAGLQQADGSRATPPARVRVELDDLYALREVFVSSAAHATGAANLGGGPEPLRVELTFVTAEFFETFRRDAARGRVFTHAETTGGGVSVTVLSDRLWRTYFGADPAVVGTRVPIDTVPHEVVGVMPPDFRFPAQAQLWVPMPVPVPMRVMSAFRNMLPAMIVARLAPGVRPELAAERLDLLRQQYLRALPEGSRPTQSPMAAANLVTPLQRSLVGDRRTMLTILMASAGLLLLIACANAATLLLSRSAARRREIATHAILGATRRRIVGRLLLESSVLTAAGAMAGLVIAAGSVSLVSAVIPPGMAGLALVQMDVRVLAFASGVTILTGLVFGLWPALGASRTEYSHVLRESAGREFTASARLNRVLVIGQVAVACLLVMGAVLLVTSLRSLLGTDLGMQLERVAAARLNLPSATYADARSRAAFVESTLEYLRHAPGVEAAAAINTLPLARESGILLRIDPEGASDTTANVSDAAPYLVVSPGYFTTMGMRLVSGRDLEWRDAAALPVAVVNRAAARRFWPGEDPTGRRFTFGGGVRTIVGVIDDARIREPEAEVGPQVYLPIQEQPQQYVSFVARGASRPAVRGLLVQIRDAVRRVDPDVPVYAAQPMEALIAEAVEPRRLGALLISVFGLLALCLAAIGVYGVLACSVAQRRREIGVRMALGARQTEVLMMVVRQGLVLVATGSALGMLAAAATTRYLQSMLYEVTPRDPATFMGVALLLVAVGIVAASVPAWRAATADPLTVLRSDEP